MASSLRSAPIPGDDDEHALSNGPEQCSRPLARPQGRAGGAQPAVYNAANEEAVAQFLDGRIQFGGIPRAIEGALVSLSGMPGGTLDALRSADRAARIHVREMAGC